MASTQSASLYGGLGAETLAGSKSRAPGQGVEGRIVSPELAKNLLILAPNRSTKFASLFVFCKLPKPQVIVIIHVKRLKVSSTTAWTSTERNLVL